VRKTLALILAVLMLATLLAACSNEPAPATPPPTRAPVAPPATAVPAATPEPGFVVPTLPLAAPVNLTALVRRSDLDATMDYNDLVTWSILEEATNIFIDWDAYTAGEAVNTAVNIMWASQAFPDFMMGIELRDDEELYGVEQGFVVPLNDFITPEIMPNFYANITSDVGFLPQITATNGMIYGFPRIWDLGYDTSGHFFVNRHFLAEVGMSISDLNSLSAIEDMLRAFAQLDSVTIPFILGRLDDDTHGPSNLVSLWGETDNRLGWTIAADNQTVTATKNTPAYRSMLEWVHKMMGENLIDRESFAQDIAAYNAKINDQSVGMFLSWRLISYGFSWDGIEDDYIVIPPMPAASGVMPKWRKESPGVQHSNIMIFQNNEHVLETCLWVDYQMDPFVGIQNRNGNLGISQALDASGRFISVWDRDNPATHDSNPGGRSVFFLTRSAIEHLWVMPPLNAEKYPYIDMYRPFHQDQLSYMLIDMGRLPASEVARRTQLRVDIDMYVQQEAMNFVNGGVTDAAWNNYVNTLNNRLNLAEYISLGQRSFDIFRAGMQ